MITLAKFPYIENVLDLNDKINFRAEKSKEIYASVYRVTSCYGGPEEGGWHYDNYELINCVICNNNFEAEKEVERLKSEYENPGTKNKIIGVLNNYPENEDLCQFDDESSVVYGENIEILTESKYGGYETRIKPHYE